MSRTDLDAETLARSLRAMAGDGSIEWVMEPVQASVLLDIADALDENAKLRERVDAAHMSRLLTENENESLRELAARAWRLFMENGAVHPSDLSEVDAVRDGLSELGVEVEA